MIVVFTRYDLLAERLIPLVSDGVPALLFDGFLDLTPSFGQGPAGLADYFGIATRGPPVEGVGEYIHNIKNRGEKISMQGSSLVSEQ
jgi:hypothetical protein